ncbi:SRPBCC domain-containing protein [Paenibacillus sp. NFR01]|uniref:SRPBCC family protein n=1 Tax=Paenibacillus sp. NFR01 TaxID=1566279 RepID=UPI0008BC334E|nr:SRPBCC domain-containing protein [Paenibacillus sp. NFR01]SEU10406.1 Uncharacterized conserved protein YndB, AHSA1/START domain [Paenibacillus sp. NFR01]
MSTQETIPAIRKTVVLNAPIEKVWNAVATAEGIAAWWMPSTFEPVLGHEFILHAGNFGDSPAKVTELDPPNTLGFDWGKDWHLQFELKTLEDGKTEFTLIHSGWDPSKLTEFGQPHTVIREVMNGGWESIVHKALVAYVEA